MKSAFVRDDEWWKKGTAQKWQVLSGALAIWALKLFAMSELAYIACRAAGCCPGPGLSTSHRLDLLASM